MRNLIILLFVLQSLNLSSQEITNLDSTIWHNDYNVALNEAKDSNKPVLIVFSGSDWCKPCIKLREFILVKPEFSDWAKQNAILVTADFPRQKKNALPADQVAKNEKMAEKFNKNGVFPLVVIINKDEKVLGDIGYLDVTPAEYITKINEILNK